MLPIECVPAGAQPIGLGLIDSIGDRAVYCSTLAIHVYDVSGPPRLQSILTGFYDRHVLSVSLCPLDPNVVAITINESQNNIVLWDISTEAITRRIGPLGPPAFHVQWSPLEANFLYSASQRGYLVCIENTPSQTLQLDVQWKFEKGGHSSAAANEHRGPLCCVLRLHPTRRKRVALGFKSGKFLILDGDKVAATYSGKEDDSIADLQWDLKSDAYLLAGSNSGALFLFDVDSKQTVWTFEKITGGLQAFAWMPTVPGDFVTVSDKAGLLRVWNVSQRVHKDMIKADHGGLQGFRFVGATATAIGAFTSGTVGVLDLPRKKWTIFGRTAHTDTVFSAAFKPSDPDILATCSFDGSLRLWDMRSHEMLRNLTVDSDDRAFFSVSWAPTGGKLATVSAAGTIIIWDSEKAVQHHRSTLSENAPCYNVDWFKGAADGKIAVASYSGKVFIISSQDFSVVSKLRHPKPCFGCNWNPFDKNVIATSCEDGIVRVWNVALPAAQPLKCSLEGHSLKVFNVLWSPLLRDVLISGSDDCSVRVWDVASRTSKSMTGHSHNVRALAWSHEIPWLAFSGSWDGTLRMWDTRTCSCISVLRDHHADIYAITSHPMRPAIFVSTSRDTTMRTWCLDDLMAPILLPLLLGEPLDPIRGDPEAMMDPMAAAHAVCCGVGSAALAQRLASSPGAAARAAAIFDFFRPARGMRNMWDMLAPQGASRDQDVVHGGQVLEDKRLVLRSLIAECDVPSSRIVMGRRMKQEERLRMAAALSLQLGELQQHCEILIRLNHWLQALAVAPAVSLEYWRSLSEQYASHLVQKTAESHEVTPFLVAAGDAKEAVHQLLQRGEFADAQALAQAAAEGLLPSPPPPPPPPPAAAEACGGGVALLSLVAETRAARYEAAGQPALAAACFLAHGQGARGVQSLLFSHELELALAVSSVLSLPPNDPLLAMLAAKAERLALWPLAAALLRRTRDAQQRLPLLAARHAAALPAAADRARSEGDLFQYLSLPPATSYRQLGETAAAAGRVAEAVRCFAVCGELPQAIDLALPPLLESLGGAPDFPRARAILEPLRGVPLDGEVVDERRRRAVLALSAFEACYQALWRGYTPVILPLLATAANLSALVGDDALPSMAIDALRLQVVAYFIRSCSTLASTVEHDLLNTPGVDHELLRSLRELQSHRPAEPSPNVKNRTVVATGSLVYTGSWQRQVVSRISGERISGASVTLDDGSSAVSKSDAIMWARLHPFSPTNSGKLLNPF